MTLKELIAHIDKHVPDLDLPSYYSEEPEPHATEGNDSLISRAIVGELISTYDPEDMIGGQINTAINTLDSVSTLLDDSMRALRKIKY